MNNTNNNIALNLRHLRTVARMTQEDVADRIGVSRQAVAKWENGDTLPDILNCEALANLFDVSLNDLVRHNPEQEGLPIGPKDKSIFGTATINERGQIVIPKKARDVLRLNAGDTLIVLGDTNPITSGIALISEEMFHRRTGGALTGFLKNMDGAEE